MLALRAATDTGSWAGAAGAEFELQLDAAINRVVIAAASNTFNFMDKPSQGSANYT